MKTSKPVRGEEACRLGLVDAVVSPNELVSTARQWALDILERRRPWIASLYKNDKIEPLGEAREIFKFARAQTQKRAPNLVHPLVCIDVIEEGIVSGPRAGLWKVVICLQNFSPFIFQLQMYDFESDIGRKLKLLMGWCSQILARAWFTFFLLSEEQQRFVVVVSESLTLSLSFQYFGCIDLKPFGKCCIKINGMFEI